MATISILRLPLLHSCPNLSLCGKAFVASRGGAMGAQGRWLLNPRIGVSAQPARRKGRVFATRARAASAMPDLAETARRGWQAAQTAANEAGEERVTAGSAEGTGVAVDSSRSGDVDPEDGLPLSYNADALQAYWEKRRGEVNRRWREFASACGPLLSKIAGALLTGGVNNLRKREREIARDMRKAAERLGPTYIKAGQLASVRRDLLGDAALEELSKLQDSVTGFSTEEAKRVVERDLNKPWYEVFDTFSEEPIAAASLAQVHYATLKGTDEEVAVKVQRPGVAQTVGIDLYVLRRAANVYQRLVDRLVPQQKTDYRELLNTWAVGLYTELDFLNEGKNQARLKKALAAMDDRVHIPEVYLGFSSRRVLVMEWVRGPRLVDLGNDELKQLLEVGKECFLRQLLQEGVMHLDPHAGNLMKLEDGRLALLDFGLCATIGEDERGAIVSSIVHTANRNWEKLVDDMVALGVLPPNPDRATVEPLMERVLSPYVFSGGGLQNALNKYDGGAQGVASDLLQALREVPFTIPAYAALLGRAIATLEGLALQADPNYKLVMEAYPFVAQKLAANSQAGFQSALADLLYSSNGGAPSLQRVLSLVNASQGKIASTSGAAIDLDSVPDDAASLRSSIRFLVGPDAKALRESFIVPETARAADILLRRAVRRAFRNFVSQSPLPSPPAVLAPLPSGQDGKSPAFALIEPNKLVNIGFPELEEGEDVYAKSLLDLVKQSLGDEAYMALEDPQPSSVGRFLYRVAVSGSLPRLQSIQAHDVANFVSALPRMLAPVPGNARTKLLGGSERAGSTDKRQGKVEELVQALSELSASEDEALRSAGQQVVDRLQVLAASRVKPLL